MLALLQVSFHAVHGNRQLLEIGAQQLGVVVLQLVLLANLLEKLLFSVSGGGPCVVFQMSKFDKLE